MVNVCRGRSFSICGSGIMEPGLQGAKDISFLLPQNDDTICPLLPKLPVRLAAGHRVEGDKEEIDCPRLQEQYRVMNYLGCNPNKVGN